MPILGQQEFVLGKWRVDPELNLIAADDSLVHLEPKVMAVLVCLAERAGEVVSKGQLMRAVWPDTFVSDQVLTHAVWQLRQVLGNGGNRSEIIETIPKKGYRLVCPVAPASVSVSADQPRSARPQRTVLFPALFFAVAVIALVALAVLRWSLRPGQRERPVQSLAILPLLNLTGDPSQEFLSDGVTEDLTTELARINPMSVVSRTSSMRYKGTQKTVKDIGRELSADALVEGSIQRTGERVRITIQLIQAANQRHLWANTYEGALDDVFGLEAQATRDLAREIKLKLSPVDDERLQRTRRVNPEAYEAYQKGVRATRIWDQPQLLEAVKYFEEATRKDPNYAPAYAQLGHTYGMLNFNSAVTPDDNAAKFRAFTQKALELDDHLAEAHINLGDIAFYGDWDWAKGETEFRRAVELDPGSVDAQEHYSLCLWALGRYKNADAEMRHALHLDPMSPRLNAELGSILRDEGDPQGAIQQYKNALELEPGYAAAFAGIGAVLEELGQDREAVAAYLRAASLQGEDPLAVKSLSDGFDAAGMRGYWASRLELLRSRAKRKPISPLTLASIYSHLARYDKALDSLDRAYHQHIPALVWIRSRKDWAPLRAHPRFRALLTTMRFPES
jgi:TolB-like protein/DNA-binding winged helix-turn-helix (wHTH) protein/Tfp pilus assembly protein PilF